MSFSKISPPKNSLISSQNPSSLSPQNNCHSMSLLLQYEARPLLKLYPQKTNPTSIKQPLRNLNLSIHHYPIYLL
jgi:hypothetical protein